MGRRGQRPGTLARVHLFSGGSFYEGEEMPSEDLEIESPILQPYSSILTLCLLSSSEGAEEEVFIHILLRKPLIYNGMSDMITL